MNGDETTGFEPDDPSPLADALRLATPETLDEAAGECCGGSCGPAHSSDADEQDGRLHRRSMPDRLRYLASQLASANVRPDTIANALEVTADELAGQVTVSRDDLATYLRATEGGDPNLRDLWDRLSAAAGDP